MDRYIKILFLAAACLTAACNSVPAKDQGSGSKQVKTSKIYEGTVSDYGSFSTFLDKKSNRLYSISMAARRVGAPSHRNENIEFENKINSFEKDIRSKKLPLVFYFKVKAKVDDSIDYNFNGSPFTDTATGLDGRAAKKFPYTPKGRLIIEDVIEGRLPKSIAPANCYYSEKLCTAH